MIPGPDFHKEPADLQHIGCCLVIVAGIVGAGAVGALFAIIACSVRLYVHG